MTTEQVWIAVGLLGQALFSARMLLQWLASERRRRSVVPKAFWYLSIGGGLVLLCYAIYRRDPVFIVGQGAGLFVYARNLYFIHKRREPVLESP
ncbi:MAG: lipid-A-disaccharide synthase N-terminal domain-containing protein [Candidatus Rokubacteria bacterium]|nr:lipid-A-disaccharide synthase N-terminal domain-containing protein [Candidatus Rokubacteria bacterium]